MHEATHGGRQVSPIAWTAMMAGVVLACGGIGVQAAPDGSDTAADALPIEMGVLAVDTLDPADDLEDWFRCTLDAPATLHSLVDAPADTLAPDWTLFMEGEDGKLSVLDHAGSLDRRLSRWYRVPAGRYLLQVRLPAGADGIVAYRCGFDRLIDDQADQLTEEVIGSPMQVAALTPTRFEAGTTPNIAQTFIGMMELLRGKLETNTFGNWDIANQYIYFQIYRNGGWQSLPDDGITRTTHWTNNDGIGESYYILPPDLPTGTWSFRVKYDGNSEYEPCERVFTVIVDPSTSTLGHRHAPTAGSGRVPVVLVHGNGSDEAVSEEYRWKWLLDYVDANPSQFETVDFYYWGHNTARAIGYNGYTGNANELANVVFNYVLPNYPPGTKAILVAHSRGGMVSRSFMNYNSNGDRIAGLITLGTPHHGSPFACPDWTAISWAIKLGTGWPSPDVYNLLVSHEGKGFKTGRFGSLQLAWDNMDQVSQGWKSIAFNVNFAVNGIVKLSYRDMNRGSSFTDETWIYPEIGKQQFGTLYDLNASESYYHKIVTFAAYDSTLADNPNWNNMFDVVYNAVGTLLSDHYGLSGITRLLAYMSEQVPFNSASYWANDGMVPLQSGHFLDLSGGIPFCDIDANENITPRWNDISARLRVKRARTFTGQVKDHLDLLDTPTSNTTYWSALADEIREFAVDASCLTPPEYNYAISTSFDGSWRTHTGGNVTKNGCRIYRVYLWNDTAYNFSLCSSDGVGGSAGTGDVDLRLFNAAGEQVWYLDGPSGCGWDATTLNSNLYDYTPPTTGYYYLKVSEYYGNPLNYTLAYQGRIRKGDLEATCEPEAARNAGAQWRVDGGDWQTSGTRLLGLWQAMYTVDFLPISGWITPAPQQVQILDGLVSYTTGTYLADCDNNGVADTVQIAGGAPDCNANQVLDTCEPDADSDGVIDGCDQCPGTPPGTPVNTVGCPVHHPCDYDLDDDVDISDFAILQNCLSGQGVEQSAPTCAGARLDADNDVDGDDVALFRNCLSGEGFAPPANCLAQ